MPPMLKATLLIEPARDGGYLVRKFDRAEGRGNPWVTLFAGPLDDCLTYVAQHFDPSRR